MMLADNVDNSDDLGDCLSWNMKRRAMKERCAEFETDSMGPKNLLSWTGGAKNQIVTPHDESRRKREEDMRKVSETHSYSEKEINADFAFSDSCVPTENSENKLPTEGFCRANNSAAQKKMARMELLRARHKQLKTKSKQI